MDAERIQRQAKALMDEFVAALETAGAGDIKEDVGLERDSSSVRKPGNPELTEGFPERMLKNAPATKDRFVVAEKKQW